jgi:hypothetical protein
MKTLLTTLILFVMLGLGCKKPVEPVTPVVQPPVLWNDACRVSRTVYKTIMDQGPLPEPEEITVGGKRVRVGISNQTHLTYDNQGRLVREDHGKTSDSLYTIYRYTATELYVNAFRKGNGKLNVRQDTVRLDTRGLANRGPFDLFYFEYNDEGYPIRRTYWNKSILGINTVEQGNLVERQLAYEGPIGTYTFRTSFDLTKANIPVIKRFLGRDSKNLPLVEITNISKSLYQPNGDVYQIEYSYTFDEQGRVKRRIAYGKPLSPNYVMAVDPGGIGVMDYEYECK